MTNLLQMIIKTYQALLEFPGIGYNDKNSAHVLCKLLYFP